MDIMAIAMVEGELRGLVEELTEELGKAIPIAVRRLAELFGLEVGPELLGDVRMAISHAIHIIIHELAHSVARRGMGWLEELPEPDRTFVDEVLARLVERYISTELREREGLKMALVEDFREQLSELRSYEQLRGISMNEADLKALYEEFLRHASRAGGACEFARHLLELRERFLRR
mgnify:CR=1 FL=1